MRETLTILIFCVSLLKEAELQDNVTCPTTPSSDSSLLWPSTSNWTLSEPPCVDKSKEFLYRHCENGDWDSEPECDYIQPKILPQCPEGFVESLEPKICYQIKEASSFPPKCPFADVLPFHSYEDLVQNLGPVWMPVQRDLSNGLGFMKWTEAGPLHGTIFKNYYFHTLKDKNCLLYYNYSYIEAASCEEEHLSVCAYSHFADLDNPRCDPGESCYALDYGAADECVCFSLQETNGTRAEFLKPYQNNVYARITDLICSINLEKNKEGTYFWNHSKTEINYTYWSPDVVFDETHIYGAITPKGWVLTEYPAYCGLLKKKKKIRTVSLSLQFGLVNKLTLTIDDSEKYKFEEISVNCFTSAAALNLIYPQLEEIFYTASSKYYEIEPMQDGPGIYWCEAFTYDTFNLVKSEKLFHRLEIRFPYEFVAILQLVYKDDINPLSEDIIEFVHAEVFPKLNKTDHLKRFYNFRIMKILDVDVPNRTVSVNIHFTYNIPDSKDNHDKEFKLVKKLVEDSFNLTNFLSADFCEGEVHVRSEPAFIERYTFLAPCIGPENRIVFSKKLCESNFIDGAKWTSAINAECQAYVDHSEVTEDILNLLNRILKAEEFLSLPSYADVLAIQNISRFYAMFSLLDVYLLQNITVNLYKYYGWYLRDELEQYIEIIGNILETEKNILLESQLKLRTMDNILENLVYRINSIQFYGLYYKQEFCNKNLFTMFISEEDINLKIINLCDQPIQILTANYANYIDAVKDIVSENAIWLNHNFFNSTSVSISILYQHASIVGHPFKTISGPIFTILHDGNEDAPIVVFQKVKTETHKTCLSWIYEDEMETVFSENNSISKDNSPYFVCEYRGQKIYSGISDKSSIVTDSITDLVTDSNVTASEAINKLRNISEEYNNFTPTDVFHIGNVLNKFEKDPEIDLEELAEIASNLQRVPQHILQSSQSEFNSTDNILRSLDRIAINHEYSSPVNVTTNNTMILIQNIKEANFTSLVLRNRDNFHSEILETDVDPDKDQEFESALVLSPELKQQLDENATIRLIIFRTSKLFVEEKSRYKHISKIFGVLLPANGTYPGPVSVYHRVHGNEYNAECAFWSYGNASQWSREHDGAQSSSVIKCDYSHTTHFALLMIEKFDNVILEIVTNVTCGVSMVGLAGIILTAVCFEKWRSEIGHKILLNFACAMILQMIFYFVSSSIDSNDRWWCTVTGTVLHYTTVSEFCWMVIIAYLQYKRYVNVLWEVPNRLLLKACLCGWLLPVIFIGIGLVLNEASYTKMAGLCYPSGLGLHLGVWLPVSIATAINLIIFGFVIRSVKRHITRTRHMFKNGRALQQWKLTFALFFLLGLPWIFGFLSASNFGYFFAVLFNLTATSQGFVIFLFYIVLDSDTRFMYWQFLRRCRYR